MATTPLTMSRLLPIVSAIFQVVLSNGKEIALVSVNSSDLQVDVNFETSEGVASELSKVIDTSKSG